MSLTEPVPSKINFYSLPRPVQDRFAAVTRNRVPPAPLLFRPAARTTAWVFLAASVPLFVVEILLLAAGWGDAASSMAIHGPFVVVLDMAFLAGAVYCVIHAAAILRSLDGLPFRPGKYLFPGSYVDADHGTFEVWRIADVASVDKAVAGSGPGVVLRMHDGSQVRVPAANEAQAEGARDALAAVLRDKADAIATEDPYAMAEIDPLHDKAMSSPIGPTDPIKPHVALWVRVDWALALVFGVALAQVFAVTRNTLSDDAMYRSAVSDGSSAAYRAYLARHGRHTDEVRDVLLPRVELREAEAAGSTDAIRDFARAHPDSKIQPEIDAALRRALLAELEKAKRAGTVSALDAFARANPEPVVEAEWKAARHALFVRAFAAWRAKARPDAAADAFMTRLVAWSEKSGIAAQGREGPAVQVRFRPKPSTSIDDADKSVTKNVHFPGADALPSHYVTPEVLRPDEQGVVDAVVKEFADAFPADVLAVRAADPLGPDDPAPAAAPSLVIEYSPEWSRGDTTNPKPLTVFAGLTFVFDAAFTIPDGGPSLKVTVKSWRAAESWKVKAAGLSLAEYEEKVYGAMMSGAFDQLRRKLVDVLF